MTTTNTEMRRCPCGDAPSWAPGHAVTDYVKGNDLAPLGGQLVWPACPTCHYIPPVEGLPVDMWRKRHAANGGEPLRWADLCAEFEAALSGYTRLDGGSVDSTEGLEHIASLWCTPALGASPDRHVYRLPDGDLLMSIEGNGIRWTRDPSAIADQDDRRQIQAHRFAPELAALLVELHRAGALRDRCGWSWFGDRWSVEQFEASAVATEYSHPPRRADEVLDALRGWLDECARLHPEHRDGLARALALALPGAIEEVRA